MTASSLCHAFAASCVAAVGLLSTPASAAPVFTAQYAGVLEARLDWSSDLGVDLINTTPFQVATGAPITQSASAVRDGRLIGAQITQTAPFVLDDQYWAAQWTGALDVPGPGFYGLGATSRADGRWTFGIPGQDAAQNAATTFYYAATWEVVGPAALHPVMSAQFLPAPPLVGSATGSFTLGNLASFGIIGFPMRPTFEASTLALDTNQPGRVTFDYRIAFSTTPITADVFTPRANVPEPSPAWLVGGGLLLCVARLRRHR